MGKVAITENDLLAELGAAWQDELPKPGEITIQQFADSTTPPITRGAAREFLERQVKAGKLSKRAAGGRVYFSKCK